MQQASSDEQACRVDMHVHSTASQSSKLGIQRSLALPECATEPEEVYELAKRRGMDFVTITDHDTIDGALSLSHLDDTFVSEELTVHFKGEPQAVHVLCYGITGEDHEWLQAHNDSVEDCAAYLSDRGITAALAHPFFYVEAPLTAAHRRRLAELFPIWETRNGSRAMELNRPAFIYIETKGGTGIGGGDDHAGIDIGRTYTETPWAATPDEFLAHIVAGRALARGAQGSAAKWTHAAMALAIRALGDQKVEARLDPGAVLAIVQRVMSEGNVRRGSDQNDLGPQDALALLRGWLESVGLKADEQRLLRALQDGEMSHDDLERRARRTHERELARMVGRTEVLLGECEARASGRGLGLSDLSKLASGFFDACLPALPYAAAGAFLGREKFKLARHDGDRPRVALVADGLGSMHGVTHTVDEIRDRGVRGFEVEVIGTDADVDRRLAAVAEIEVPFYPGLSIGVPSVTAVTDAISEGRYDLVHVVSPGPAGLIALGLAKVMEFPLVGSYHTELGAYAALRSGRRELEMYSDMALGAFYGACDTVLSPSRISDQKLLKLGIADTRIGRWDRGVDLTRFDPALRDEGLLGGGAPAGAKPAGDAPLAGAATPAGGRINVLYAGRQTKEKGVDLLAAAFLAARERDPRLHLVLAGGGPEQEQLAALLGEHASFLGWLEGEALARTYASADIFAFASQTDTFGQVILEAQASGLPVVAVNAGGPCELIDDGESGLLVAAEADALAAGIEAIATRPLLADRLRRGGLDAVRERSWEASLERLAAGYRWALQSSASARQSTVAAA